MVDPAGLETLTRACEAQCPGLAADPPQPFWDVRDSGPDLFYRVKTGGVGYVGEVQGLLTDAPNIHFTVSAEIYDRIMESAPDLAGQLVDIGPGYLLVEGIQDGLNALSDGLDTPGNVGRRRLAPGR